MEDSRPLDALNKARNKRVIVELKNGKQYVGKLNAFDIHINIVLEEAEEKVGRLMGPFNYCMSILLLITIFVIVAPGKLYFPIAGILLMIISDTLASVVGKKYGKRKINLPWLSTTRSLEGSLVFFISGFVLCLFAFTFIGVVSTPITQIHLTLEVAFLYSLITSALATIIELASPSTYDDLTVPIFTTLIIFLLTLI